MSYAEKSNRRRSSVRANTFIIAAGYAWSSHLLLLSGLANRSGLVGRYLTGHRGLGVQAEVPMRMYPGIYGADSLLSKRYQRPHSTARYVRHDLRVWESSFARQPRMKDDAGNILFGDDMLADWRKRCATGTARMRCYYDVPPTFENALTIDPAQKNEWGDPLPRIEYVDREETKVLRAAAESQIGGVFDEIVKAGGGKIIQSNPERFHDHPGGGCRMGTLPDRGSPGSCRQIAHSGKNPALASQLIQVLVGYDFEEELPGAIYDKTFDLMKKYKVTSQSDEGPHSF